MRRGVVVGRGGAGVATGTGTAARVGTGVAEGSGRAVAGAAVVGEAEGASPSVGAPDAPPATGLAVASGVSLQGRLTPGPGPEDHGRDRGRPDDECDERREARERDAEDPLAHGRQQALVPDETGL